MSDETKGRAAQNLMEFKEIMDDLGVPFWLEGGTILGAYRDRDFCEDDENDIDLGTWSNYHYALPIIVEECLGRGFTLHRHWKGDERAPDMAQQIAVERNGMKIDLFCYEKRDDLAWACTYLDDRCIPQVVPVHFFEELKQIVFYGKKFNIPRDVEGYLSHRYGDWKTKIHRSEFSCYNPDQLHALDPEFKFWEK